MTASNPADAEDCGWGHYDACPAAYPQVNSDADCCCSELAIEYADEDELP